MKTPLGNLDPGKFITQKRTAIAEDAIAEIAEEKQPIGFFPPVTRHLNAD